MQRLHTSDQRTTKRVIQCHLQPQILTLSGKQIQAPDGSSIKYSFITLNPSNAMILQLVKDLIQSQFLLVYIMKWEKIMP